MPPSGLIKRRIAWLLAAGLLAAVVVLLYVSYALAAPVPAVVGAPPADLRAEAIEIPSASGSRLRGWLCAVPGSRGVVVLMHGVRANRLSMVDRTPFLTRAGYSVLLFDFQAHGESSGEHITFGYLESRDARAAVELVRRRFPGQPVAAIGSSLGGASAVLADPPLGLDALVLESVYPTVEQATRNRLRIYLGPLGPPLAPLLLAQLKPRLGISPSTLRPIDRIGGVGCPVFVLGGTKDGRTPPEETQALFAKAREPKRLWLVPGADHVDLHGFARREYERRILEFLTSPNGAQ